MPPGDPNLNPDWQWWTDGAPVDLYYSPAGGTPIYASVNLPWNTDGNIIKSYQPDIYPEDGWLLAYRDFGTSAFAPQFPYFVLYNKYRGKFRLMLFKPYQQNNTHYIAEISFMGDPSGLQHTALMTFNAEEKSFLDDFSKTQVDSSIAKMDVYGSWGVFDFEMTGYDPKLDDPSVDPVIQITIKGVNTQNVQLKSQGNLSLDQVLTNSSLSFSRPSTFETVSSAIGSAVKIYKTIDGFATDLNKAVTDKKPDGTLVNQGKPWLEAAQAIAPIVSTLGPWGAAAGAGIGLITGLIGGGGKSAPMEPLRFKGMLDFTTTGSITDNQAVLAPLDLYLKPGPQSLLGQRPVRPISWGLFNLRTKPSFTNDIHMLETGVWSDESEGPVWHPTGLAFSYCVFTGNQPEVVINPNLNMTLVSKKVRFGKKHLIDYNHWLNLPIDFDQATNDQNHLVGIDLIGVELTFQINSPVKYSDTTIKAFKAYPITMNINTFLDGTEQ